MAEYNCKVTKWIVSLRSVICAANSQMQESRKKDCCRGQCYGCTLSDSVFYTVN